MGPYHFCRQAASHRLDPRTCTSCPINWEHNFLKSRRLLLFPYCDVDDYERFISLAQSLANQPGLIDAELTKRTLEASNALSSAILNRQRVQQQATTSMDYQFQPVVNYDNNDFTPPLLPTHATNPPHLQQQSNNLEFGYHDTSANEQQPYLRDESSISRAQKSDEWALITAGQYPTQSSASNGQLGQSQYDTCLLPFPTSTASVGEPPCPTARYFDPSTSYFGASHWASSEFDPCRGVSGNFELSLPLDIPANMIDSPMGTDQTLHSLHDNLPTDAAEAAPWIAADGFGPSATPTTQASSGIDIISPQAAQLHHDGIKNLQFPPSGNSNSGLIGEVMDMDSSPYNLNDALPGLHADTALWDQSNDFDAHTLNNATTYSITDFVNPSAVSLSSNHVCVNDSFLLEPFPTSDINTPSRESPVTRQQTSPALGIVKNVSDNVTSDRSPRSSTADGWAYPSATPSQNPISTPDSAALIPRDNLMAIRKRSDQHSSRRRSQANECSWKTSSPGKAHKAAVVKASNTKTSYSLNQHRKETHGARKVACFLCKRNKLLIAEQSVLSAVMLSGSHLHLISAYVAFRFSVADLKMVNSAFPVLAYFAFDGFSETNDQLGRFRCDLRLIDIASETFLPRSKHQPQRKAELHLSYDTTSPPFRCPRNLDHEVGTLERSSHEDAKVILRAVSLFRFLEYVDDYGLPHLSGTSDDKFSLIYLSEHILKRPRGRELPPDFLYPICLLNRVFLDPEHPPSLSDSEIGYERNIKQIVEEIAIHFTKKAELELNSMLDWQIGTYGRQNSTDTKCRTIMLGLFLRRLSLLWKGRVERQRRYCDLLTPFIKSAKVDQFTRNLSDAERMYNMYITAYATVYRKSHSPYSANWSLEDHSAAFGGDRRLMSMFQDVMREEIAYCNDPKNKVEDDKVLSSLFLNPTKAERGAKSWVY
ncbi:hypothetical protein ACLMJK_009597 [Lecanora helva]